ncbi:MAG: cyclic pyranopterin monophosphate synthase MoaC [Candidatus Omnitrophota bacterium]
MQMIDISEKNLSARTAVARVCVKASAPLMRKIKYGRLPKGDCLQAARLAGILAAKNTARIIPLCHQITLSHVSIDFKFVSTRLEIKSTVKARYATGVEMEALLACSVAALTIYDMAKTEEKGMVITDLKLLKKTGGKSGEYIA